MVVISGKPYAETAHHIIAGEIFMRISESGILKIEDIDKFSYNLEEGTIEELEIGEMLERKWEYNGKEVSGQNLLKILNYIKVETLADQGQQKV